MPLTSDAIANILKGGGADYLVQLGVGVCDTCWNASEVKTLARIGERSYRCGCGGTVAQMEPLPARVA